VGLSEEEILELLKEDAKTKFKRGAGKRGPRKEDTSVRLVNVWFKLQHHICMPDCAHRTDSPTGNACWNPECVDPRERTDRGVNVVALVNEKWMCRYCFLNGWLLK
jgi:hypothetical protein